MNTRIPTTAVAVVLLGVVAVGAAGFGLLLVMLGSVASDFLGGSLGSTAEAALVVVGILGIVLAAAAVVGARELVAGRRSGVGIGLVIGAVLVVAPVVALASGGWHPALAASLALGSGLLASGVAILGTRTQA